MHILILLANRISNYCIWMCCRGQMLMSVHKHTPDQRCCLFAHGLFYEPLIDSCFSFGDDKQVTWSTYRTQWQWSGRACFDAYAYTLAQGVHFELTAYFPYACYGYHFSSVRFASGGLFSTTISFYNANLFGNNAGGHFYVILTSTPCTNAT